MLFSALFAVLVASPVQVEFNISERGTFVIELDAKSAPKTCQHFEWLIEQKAYDGMLFHRKVDGFVIQTGDPDSKSWLPAEARRKPGEMGGTEGLGESTFGPSIPFEKSPLSHTKGTVGVALESPGDNSGSSQIFINLSDNRRLDGKYVAFAKVVEGWNVVETLRRGDLIQYARIRKQPQ